MIVVDSKEYHRLLEKYPAGEKVILDIVEKLGEYYNQKPFPEKYKHYFIQELKDTITFINENSKEETTQYLCEEEQIELVKVKLKECYNNIIILLKRYCDLNNDYYSIISLWIIGTYYHHQFNSYPYLFINAMKGSGKTRLLKLITSLSKEGELLGSLTEAVLFRTKGTLGIDEFEHIGKGIENLRELLNAGYKKGIKVKRMKKTKTPTGEEQIVESFEVYRPLVLANIWGMENVLGDRCITLILEKSDLKGIINLIEDFDNDISVRRIKSELMSNLVTLCRYFSHPTYIQNWNNYITSLTSLTSETSQTSLFLTKLYESNINGRDLELALPLLILADFIDFELFEKVLEYLTKIIKEKKEEDLIENKDILLYDFVSQEVRTGYISMMDLIRDFRDFTQSNEDWLNIKWLGRALKRLNLIVQKRKVTKGREIILNIKKAQEKMRMFK